MTLQQGLEKLAVLAGDFVKIVDISVHGKHWGLSTADIKIGCEEIHQWLIFGAVCGYCENRRWDYALNRVDGKSKFRIFLPSMIESEYLESDATAAVLALVQVLDDGTSSESQENDCGNCLGTGKLTTVPGSDSGDYTKVIEDCIFCKGTGKKKKVTQ